MSGTDWFSGLRWTLTWDYSGLIGGLVIFVNESIELRIFNLSALLTKVRQPACNVLELVSKYFKQVEVAAKFSKPYPYVEEQKHRMRKQGVAHFVSRVMVKGTLNWELL